MIRRIIVAAALVLLVSPCLASAQEWTRFRGPNGAGQSDAKTIPDNWSASDYNWVAKLPGIGHSSPVLWGKKIFLTSADPESGMRLVFCVNAADGAIVWKREFPATTHPIHLQNSFASSTPAVDKDHVYVAWGTPDEYPLMALTHDGKDVWRINLGPFKSAHGFGTSPIIYDDMVVITNDQDGDSFVIAVGCKDGQTRWKIPRKNATPQNASYAAPCVYKPAGKPDELIINSWAHGVSSHEPYSGRTLWEVQAFPLRTVGSPVITAGMIFGNCGAGNGNNTVAAVQPGPNPEVKYTIDKTSAPYVPTLLAAGDLMILWGDRGIVACIDAATGKMHWRERVGGNYSGSPVLVRDRVYCMSHEGEAVVLAAADKYQLISKVTLGEGTHATPAIADGVMYLRTESQLFSLGGKKETQNVNRTSQN